MLHAPAFVVLGTWALVLMFRDYSRELGLVGLSGLRLVRLPFGMAVHVRAWGILLYVDSRSQNARIVDSLNTFCFLQKLPASAWGCLPDLPISVYCWKLRIDKSDDEIPTGAL